MGICSSETTADPEKIKVKDRSTNRNNKPKSNDPKKSVAKKEKENDKEKAILTDTFELEPEFQDKEEWDGERYSGLGIKKVKSYKCNMFIDELNKLREKFWANRMSNPSSSSIWKQLRIACIVDHGIKFYNFKIN